MFNPQAPLPEVSNRTLLLRHSLAAAFKARKRSLPPVPESLPLLIDSLQRGFAGLLSRPGARDALASLRARLFHVPGREAEAESCWRESLATAVYAAHLAPLIQARGASVSRVPAGPVSVAAAACGGLLHRAGEVLALKILARVELEFRLQVDGASRREWCTSHGHELAEYLIKAWELTPACSSCVLGWMRFGEFGAVSAESAAVYLGRLFAIELLHPDWCVPGALEESVATVGLFGRSLEEVREQGLQTRELIRVLD